MGQAFGSGSLGILAVGGAQIKRAGWRACRGDRGTEPCHPGDIRRRCASTLKGRQRLAASAFRQEYWRIADRAAREQRGVSAWRSARDTGGAMPLPLR